MDLTTTVITTDRLKLVTLSQQYAKDIYANFTKEITTYMFAASPTKLAETIAYIHEQLPKVVKGEDLPIVILDKQTGEFLGGGGLHHLDTQTPHFGIWIKKNAHGNHYGKEALHGLKQWADENLSYDYLIYPVDKRNIPSRKIAESLGGIVKKEYIKKNMSGNMLDEVEYWIYKK